jgi:hypothetical protein
VLIYSGKERQKINSDDRRTAVLQPTSILCVHILWEERQKINSDDRMAAVLPPTSILCVNILWEGETKDKQRRQNGCCSATYKYGRRGKR